MIPGMTPEKERRLRELLDGTGIDLDAYLGGIAQTDKEQRRAGVTFKAADIDSLLADVRDAFDNGDGAAFDRAVQALIQMRPTSGGRTSDLTARAPIGSKAARSFDALMDSVSESLKRTGGNQL